MKQRFRCVCAYEGTDFQGWQSQPNGMGVQDVIEKRLAFICGEPVRIHGSGRTDSGVHAKGQVFHFDADWEHGTRSLLAAFSSNMPPTIQVKRIHKAAADFHARFGVSRKRYIYRVYQGQASPFDYRYCWELAKPLDVAAMQAAAPVFCGTMDFRAFAGAHKEMDQDNPVKTVYRMDVLARGQEIRLVTEGSGYLYKMVRSMVGALVDVGRGRLSAKDIERLLAGKVRTREVVTAPAKGLCLDRVWY